MIKIMLSLTGEGERSTWCHFSMLLVSLPIKDVHKNKGLVVLIRNKKNYQHAIFALRVFFLPPSNIGQTENYGPHCCKRSFGSRTGNAFIIVCFLDMQA